MATVLGSAGWFPDGPPSHYSSLLSACLRHCVCFSPSDQLSSTERQLQLPTAQRRQPPTPPPPSAPRHPSPHHGSGGVCTRHAHPPDNKLESGERYYRLQNIKISLGLNPTDLVWCIVILPHTDLDWSTVTDTPTLSKTGPQ